MNLIDAIGLGIAVGKREVFRRHNLYCFSPNKAAVGQGDTHCVKQRSDT
jgi:hypothetical protein